MAKPRVGIKPLNIKDLSGPVDEVCARLQRLKKRYEKQGFVNIQVCIDMQFDKHTIFFHSGLGGDYEHGTSPCCAGPLEKKGEQYRCSKCGWYVEKKE